MSSTVRLNLGCGGDVREGFLNLDLHSNAPGVTRGDVRKLDLAFQEGSVDEIVAQDILEHMSHREVHDVLAMWCRLLKPGGTIEIRVPDIEKQIDCYLEGPWDLAIFNHMVYAGQEHPGNYHCCCFHMMALQEALEKNGVDVVEGKYMHNGITGDIATSNNPNLWVKGVKRG